QSIIEGNRPIRKTLRPSKEESKNWETTENLYIEGDNLEVLKLLQNSYLNKVKMIYIDPPYNTGNDFIYRDNFKVSKEDYEEELGLFDEEENRLFKNTETNGRYHSDWCSMMYPRLQLARNLLTDDGVIFISIDDNEVHNLRKICDEVFGEENFVAQIVWQKKYAATNDSKGFSTTHDYIIVYQKSEQFQRNLLPRTEDQNKPYKNNDNDGRGLWRADNILVKTYSSTAVYPIVNPNTGKEYYPPKGSSWRANKETMEKWIFENRIFFGKDGNGAPQLKRYLNEVQQGRVPITWWTYEDAGHNDSANREVGVLFESKTPFDTPKPVKLLKLILQISTNDFDNSIILDFFSGSATTAHAVMQLNAEDGGNRKFIMVQLPEETDPKSEANKAGYKNICEIGKERIRRAGKKIEEELITKSKEGGLFKNEERRTLDTGFRVLKVDSTNMKDVYYSPSQYNQQMLLELESNIKDDRTDIDLLYGVLLDWGVPLSLPHITEKIGGKNVHFVNDTDLVACFEEQVPEEVIREIARRKPLRVVFRDSSFRNSPDKINVTEIFKTLSPETTIKVI
ncbi:MAG: site-specific DNA-methyltransferase, partial [Clostridia bacterium]|nr:site-specific DNA-methyltransferase [Clostridia bacterium]